LSSDFPSSHFVSALLHVAPLLHLPKRKAAMATMLQCRGDWDNKITMTLRIERSVRQGITVFALSGHMNAEEVAELKALFDTNYRTIVLNELKSPI